MAVFKNETKQNKTTTNKKKNVSPGGSQARDLGRVGATHYPLRHATIIKIVWQINSI